MIQGEVRELAGVFKGDLRRHLDPFPPYVLDDTWPSVGLLDALASRLYGREDWSPAERVFISGVAAHLGEMVHECWSRFAPDVVVAYQKAVVCTARRDDGSVYRWPLEAELVAALQTPPSEGCTTPQPLRFPCVRLERFALAGCLGYAPTGRQGAREAGPGGGVDHVSAVLDHLAEGCASHYGRRFPDEPLGREPGLYVDLVRPPLGEVWQLVDVGDAILSWLDGRSAAPTDRIPILDNLLRFSAAAVRTGALVALLADDRARPTREVLERIAHAVRGSAARFRRAGLALALRRGRQLDWLDGAPKGAQRFEFERAAGLLPLVQLSYEACRDPLNRELVEALVADDPATAFATLQTAPMRVGSEAERLAQEALLWSRLGDVERAELLYLRLDREHGEAVGPEVYLQGGRCALDRGHVARSVDWLEEAAALAPEDDRVMIELGRAYAAAGRRTEALAQLNRALRRGRRPFAALLARADLRSEMGSYEASYGDLVAAARLRPFDRRVVDRVMAGYWSE